jgi:hypothetical protein
MNSTLIRILPYAGTLPFLLGTAAALTKVFPEQYDIDMRHVVMSYGLAIISFMAGVHWGQHLSGVRGKMSLLITSNVITLAAWFASLWLSPRQNSYMLSALFVALYLIDKGLGLTPGYLQTRRNVTLIVCASLMVLSLA